MRGGASSTSTLNEAAAPATLVSGAMISAGPGMVVTQARFIPVGAHTALVIRGFEA